MILLGHVESAAEDGGSLRQASAGGEIAAVFAQRLEADGILRQGVVDAVSEEAFGLVLTAQGGHDIGTERLGIARSGGEFGIFRQNGLHVVERLAVVAQDMIHVGEHQAAGVFALGIALFAAVVVDGAGGFEPFGIAAVVVDDGHVGQRPVVVAPVAAVGGDMQGLREAVEGLAVVEGVDHVEDAHGVEHHDPLTAHSDGVGIRSDGVEVIEHRVGLQQAVIGPSDPYAEAETGGAVAPLFGLAEGGDTPGDEFRMAAAVGEGVEPEAEGVGLRCRGARRGTGDDPDHEDRQTEEIYADPVKKFHFINP